jgi:hypothetical protein
MTEEPCLVLVIALLTNLVAGIMFQLAVMKCLILVRNAMKEPMAASSLD